MYLPESIIELIFFPEIYREEIEVFWLYIVLFLFYELFLFFPIKFSKNFFFFEVFVFKNISFTKFV